MVRNFVDMSSVGMITEVSESVYQHHSSSLHVRNNESFQKKQTHLFSVISMMVIYSLNQTLEYFILQVANYLWRDFLQLLHA